jgi:phosphate transport system substrate-binding protein
MPTRPLTALRIVATVAVVAATTLLGLASPAAAQVTVDGAGSTWSQIAVDQWRADVARQGVTINYQGVGSTAGRVAYYQGQVDFAVSEIPFQTGGDGGGVNEVAAAAARPYVYLPIVAGGTAFMYNLEVAGSRVTDLRLSPDTVAKIFTGEIRNWNDPQVSADNRGRQFPNLPIKPVIRSDGSGTSAQFTAYMAAKTPGVWAAFCQKSGLGANCPPTSLYPNPPGSGFAAQQFSDGVANFVAAPFNNGAITYVEYGYAKERGFPVASVLNAAGFYVQPTAQAVSIALQGAAINPDGTQVLAGVYDFPDNRAYPVSSYSYMIAPTTEAGPFNAAEGTALGNYISYFLCAGQQKAEQLGYSPLPRNLVEIGFQAMRRIPGAAPPPAIEACANPTITGDFITGAAPPPPETDAADPGLAGGGGGGGGGDALAGGPGGGGGGLAGAGASGTGAGGVDPLATETAAGTVYDDVLGGGGPTTAGSLAAARSVTGPGSSGLPTILYVLIVVVALAAVFGVPTLAMRLDERRQK